MNREYNLTIDLSTKNITKSKLLKSVTFDQSRISNGTNVIMISDDKHMIIEKGDNLLAEINPKVYPPAGVSDIQKSHLLSVPKLGYNSKILTSDQEKISNRITNLSDAKVSMSHRTLNLPQINNRFNTESSKSSHI